MIRPTTFIEAKRLSERLGVEIVIASETFQHTGSFKFRAAYNVVTHIRQPLVIAASSGNFGQAMAYACSLVGKSSIIVMPSTSAKVKIEAVREYGGTVEFVDVGKASREARVNELVKLHPDAYVASAYDDSLVIEGNSSLGRELAHLTGKIDLIMTPIGGGGLAAGIVSGLREKGALTEVMGCEPLLANDAARSFRAGCLIRDERESDTIADGARTLSLGIQNWDILKSGLADIIEVPEGAIREAVKLLFHFVNLKVEPTGALTVAALLARPNLFRTRRVCCVASGGNVDPALYASLIAEPLQPVATFAEGSEMSKARC